MSKVDPSIGPRDPQPEPPAANLIQTPDPTLVTAPSTTLPFPFCPDLIRPAPIALQVITNFSRFLKKSGRSFTVTESASDGLPLFVVESGTQGKRRNFQDRNGEPLFDLKRNWMSQKKAWEVTDAEGNVIMAVKYEWMHWHMTLEATLPVEAGDVGGSGQTVVRVRGNDVWHKVQEARVVRKGSEKDAGEPFLRAECTNLLGNSGFMSSYQVEPPIWDVRVAEGVNLALVS